MSIRDWRKGIWSKDDWKRFFMHFPVGVICAWLVFQIPAIGIIASIGFMFYEVLEDWRIKDLSFKDMLGFLWGFIFTSLALVIMNLGGQ